MLRRISVCDTERVLIFDDDRLRTIAGPGTHYILDVLGEVRVEYYSILEPAFIGPVAEVLIHERPLLRAEWFHLVDTCGSEVAIVSIDGQVNRIVAPDSRVLFWKGFHTLSTRIVNVLEAPDKVPAHNRESEPKAAEPVGVGWLTNPMK